MSFDVVKSVYIKSNFKNLKMHTMELYFPVSQIRHRKRWTCMRIYVISVHCLKKILNTYNNILEIYSEFEKSKMLLLYQYRIKIILLQIVTRVPLSMCKTLRNIFSHIFFGNIILINFQLKIIKNVFW